MPPILRMRLQELRNQQGRIVQEKDKSKETTHTVKQELRSSAQIIEVRPCHVCTVCCRVSAVAGPAARSAYQAESTM